MDNHSEKSQVSDDNKKVETTKTRAKMPVLPQLLPVIKLDFAPADTIDKKGDSLSTFDTLGIKDSIATDSLLAKDTVKIDSLALDSTARMEHFKVVREDVPYTSFNTVKRSAFYATPSNYKRVIEIDSAGGFVNIKEFIGNTPIRYTLRLTFDQYLQMALDNRDVSIWQELGYKYELKESKKELSDLLKDITDFEIPLPSVGVLSIFGPPVISLRIGGAVDIRAHGGTNRLKESLRQDLVTPEMNLTLNSRFR
ncbi:hypothetical protein MASR2M39_14030 [Ignavibacteriales bacterium]